MPVHLLIFCSCIAHVENVAQDFVAVEAEAEGAEGQEELYQEFEAADQAKEQFPVSNLTNSVSQPGKHRFMLNPVPFRFESYNYFYTYAFKLIGVV